MPRAVSQLAMGVTVELTASGPRLTRLAKCPCEGFSARARRAAQVVGRPRLISMGGQGL